MNNVMPKAAMPQTPPRPGGAGAGRILKGIGSLLLSLLYVIFFPLIGLVMLVMLVLKRIRPTAEGVPAAQLGEVCQDGGKPVDGDSVEEKGGNESTPEAGGKN